MRGRQEGQKRCDDFRELGRCCGAGSEGGGGALGQRGEVPLGAREGRAQAAAWSLGEVRPCTPIMGSDLRTERHRSVWLSTSACVTVHHSSHRTLTQDVTGRGAGFRRWGPCGQLEGVTGRLIPGQCKTTRRQNTQHCLKPNRCREGQPFTVPVPGPASPGGAAVNRHLPAFMKQARQLREWRGSEGGNKEVAV